MKQKAETVKQDDEFRTKCAKGVKDEWVVGRE